MPASVKLNKLLARDEVARVVDRRELPEVSSDAATYGLAMIVDKNFNVVYHAQKGDPPRKVREGEVTLIATNEILRINFLSGVPNNDNKRAVGVNIGQIKETDKTTGKERAVRLRATLEFKIDRHNRKIADEIAARMRERGATRLTKKQLLSDFGADLKEQAQNFIQTAINDVGVANMSSPEIQEREKQVLGPVMSEMGLTFSDIVVNPDKRPAWQRLILPSPSYDPRWAFALKIIIPVGAIAAATIVTLYGVGVFEPEPGLGALLIDNSVVTGVNITCAVVGSEQPGAGVCRAPAGERILVDARATAPVADQTSIEVFERWDCPVTSPWCAGVNRTQAMITLTVPDELGEFIITPIYRTDRLVKLRIETSEPRIADIPAATVRAQDCSDARCNQRRDGADNLYIFQVRDGEPAPIVTITPPADSQYNFNKLRCDGGQCPTSGGEGLTLTLASDVTAQAIYSREIVLIIVNQSIDFGSSNLPENCVSGDPTIRCLFDSDEPVTLSIVADRSSDTTRFVHWRCEGGACGVRRDEIGVHDGVFRLTNETLQSNMTVTPIFEDIVFTALTTFDALGGSVRADCHQSNSCLRESGWRTAVTAMPDDGYRFALWECIGDSCPSSRTTNPVTLTLNSNVTLTPIFDEIATVSLTIGNTPNGSAEADCDSNCDRTPNWNATVTAMPDDGYEFNGWICVGSCPAGSARPEANLTIREDTRIAPVFTLIATPGTPTDSVALSTDTRIAFSDGRYIYTSLPDGTDRVQITRTSASDSFPSWSPDGARIAFFRNNQIYTMASNGSDVRQLTANLNKSTNDLVWSPDGARIAFVSNDEIYTISSDGSDARQMTRNLFNDSNPSWSPDGSRIAFISRRAGGDEIYTMLADGSNITRLTDNEFNDIQPAWSPDGTRIAFVSNRDGDNEIYTMFFNGSGVAQLTDNQSDDTEPAWSPDGARIAFASNRDDDSSHKIYTMRQDGSDVKQFTDGAKPAWSPDGTRIVFNSAASTYTMRQDGSDVKRISHSGEQYSWSRVPPIIDESTMPTDSVTPVSLSRDTIRIAFKFRGHAGIYTMAFDGTDVKSLTRHDNDFEPAWSPDGARIAFVIYKNSDQSLNIYTILADGSDVKQLTDNPSEDREPAWSPNGARIAFVRYSDRSTHIYTMLADGSDVKQLTDNQSYDREPAWSPDGARIVFSSGGDIYTMASDNGLDIRRLTDNQSDDREPAWSPDGARIAFASNRDGDYEIYTMAFDGTDVKQLTDNQSDDREPAWSHDGARIAFVGNDQIHTMTFDGTDVKQLTDNTRSFYTQLAWSP